MKQKNGSRPSWRVTACPEHIGLARRAAREGSVLLKNEGGVLPFSLGARLAVFGKAQHDYVKGGGGSGDVTTAYVRTVWDGLVQKEQEGKLSLFRPLSEFYRSFVEQQYAAGLQPGGLPEPVLPDGLLEQARRSADTAVLVFCRFSCEGRDRTARPGDGDFYLSASEQALVEAVKGAFPRIVVVLNIGAVMDVSWFAREPRIQSALLGWQGGMEGGAAIADLLCGDACPCGRLADTFALGYPDYPSAAEFSRSSGGTEYTEDIYVGYRYFETIPGASDRVLYPFGYGGSYTSFSLRPRVCETRDDRFRVVVKVTNTGCCAGRTVVQIYCQAPVGRLGKPARVLVGFSKTQSLEPGGTQEVTVCFSAADFSSFDDTGEVCRSSYVLEAGDYRFYAGEDVRSAQPLDLVYSLAEDRVLERLTSLCPPRALRKRLCSDGSFQAGPAADDAAPALPYDREVVPADGSQPTGFPRPAREKARPEWEDLRAGRFSPEAFADSLTEEEKLRLLGGQPNMGIADTGGLGGMASRGIPAVMTADGPAGLRIRPEHGVATTAFPCATLLACCWDPSLTFQIGRAAAEEAQENGISIWLAPAVNIHRDPLCGRNFEYYSEDPLLTGTLASAMVQGIQSVGVAACLKHFACNNKEEDRRESDSRLSERALREIYLRAFAICVRQARPWTVMSAYNAVHGVRASENRQLLTGILRNEWGFQGLVMTDWYTHSSQYREIAAGNDVKMACGMPEHTLEMLRSGQLSPRAVQESVVRLLRLLLRLDAGRDSDP